MTKRPQNCCASCGATWYPRGSDQSSNCPKCRSANVSKVGPGIVGVIGTALLFWFLSTSERNSHPATDATYIPNTSIATEVELPAKPIVATPSTLPKLESSAEPIAQPQEIQMPSRQTDTEVPRDTPGPVTQEAEIPCSFSSPIEALRNCNDNTLNRLAKQEEDENARLVANIESPDEITTHRNSWVSSSLNTCSTVACLIEAYKTELNYIQQISNAHPAAP